MTPASRQRQINASKTKEIQAKRLGFPWIPLAGSGLFNGLRRIQIKKSFPMSHCGPTATRISSTALDKREPDQAIGKHSIGFLFSQENAWFLVRMLARKIQAKRPLF